MSNLKLTICCEKELAALTVQPVEEEDKEDVEEENISDQCPHTNPVPVGINKDPTNFKKLNPQRFIRGIIYNLCQIKLFI